MLAASAERPDLTGAAEHPPLPATPEAAFAYEEARRVEDERHSVLVRISDVRDWLQLILEALRRHQTALAKTSEVATERSFAFDGAAKAAATAADSKASAIDAADRFREAALNAQKAAAVYATATLPERRDRARTADSAAEVKVSAKEQVLTSTRDAAGAVVTMRRALEESARFQARFVAIFAKLVTSSAQLLPAAEKLHTAVGRATASATLVEPLVGLATDTARQVAAIASAGQALGGQLKLTGRVADNIEKARDSELPGVPQVVSYIDAEVNSTLEADAEAYAWALRRTNIGPCPPGSQCGTELDGELDAAREAALAALQEARREFRASLDNVLETRRTAMQMEALAGLADSDRETLRALGTSIANVEALAARSSAAVELEYERFNQAYLDAQRAANAAYEAAFGTPRPAPPPAPLRPPEPPEPRPVPAAPPPPAAGGGPQIADHVYELVTALGSVPPDYGAYTYVLFARRVGPPLAEQVKQRYEALLSAILGTTGRATEIRSHNRRKFNVFCIPSTNSGPRAAPTLDNYKSGLALSLLSTARGGVIQRTEILQKLRSSPGPFLLTTLEPLDKVRTTSAMLFADLAPYAPTVFPDIVTAYKNSLVEKPPRTEEVWDPPFAMWLASSAVTMGAHIAELQKAMAPFFSSGGTPAPEFSFR